MSFPPWDVPEDPLCRQRPGPVVVEPEREQAPEVQSREADLQPGLVALETSIAQAMSQEIELSAIGLYWR